MSGGEGPVDTETRDYIDKHVIGKLDALSQRLAGRLDTLADKVDGVRIAVIAQNSRIGKNAETLALAREEWISHAVLLADHEARLRVSNALAGERATVSERVRQDALSQAKQALEERRDIWAKMWALAPYAGTLGALVAAAAAIAVAFISRGGTP